MRGNLVRRLGTVKIALLAPDLASLCALVRAHCIMFRQREEKLLTPGINTDIIRRQPIRDANLMQIGCTVSA